MKLRVEESSGGQTVTTITGCFRDQAALSGVLNTLYEWHLTLLSVQRMEEQQTP